MKEDRLKKRYIKVSSYIDDVGIEVPTEIKWLDNRTFKIDRVLHYVCKDTYLKLTVLIGKKQKFIYREENGWFVFEKM